MKNIIDKINDYLKAPFKGAGQISGKYIQSFHQAQTLLIAVKDELLAEETKLEHIMNGNVVPLVVKKEQAKAYVLLGMEWLEKNCPEEINKQV